MPSAIKVKKMAANIQSSDDEAETPEKTPTETDSEKTPSKSKKASVAHISFLDAELIDAKRKRTIPKEELAAAIWLKENFETVEEGTLTAMKLYGLFSTMCMESILALPPITVFRRVLTNELGGSQYQVKEGSAYKGVVNEKKKIKKDSSESKVSATTSIKMKIKDHILEALQEGGSPKKGLRFIWIKQNLMTKFPSLRLDQNPLFLKIALERCVNFGYVQLVRGIGLVGYYRLPGDYPESEEDKPKKKKSKVSEKTAEKDEAGKEGEDKPENGDAKEGEEKKEENGKTEETPADENKEQKKKKKKSKRSKPGLRKVFGVSRHVEPKKIADVFPMAMTFMTEPKDASAKRIHKYIEKYFPDTGLEDNFKKVLMKGRENGLWEQVTGTGVSGSYRLQVQDINPLHCETLEEQICLSILACHEPKQTSVVLLKEYINEYHPNFGIDKRPYLFKKALQKEEKEGTIIRLTGIGCSGSFQLEKPFTPCPKWLAGEEDDYEEAYEGVVLSPVDQVYKARPSKRKGRGRAAAAMGRQPDFVSHSTYSKAAKPKSKKSKPKVVYAEDQDSDEEAAPKKRSKPTKKRTEKASTSKGKRAAKKGRRQSGKIVEESDGDESEPETKAATSGRKRSPNKSKGSVSRKSSVKKSPQKSKSLSSSKKKSGRKEAESDLEEGEFKSPRMKRKINYSEDQDEASKDERPSLPRQRRSPVKNYKMTESSDEEGEVTPPRKRKTDNDESEDEITPQMKSKTSSGSKSRATYSKGRASYSDSEDDGVPIKSKSRSAGKSSSRRAADTDSEDDELPSKSKSRSAGKSSSKRAADTDSEDDELPSKSKSRSADKSSSKRAADTDSEDGELPSKSKSRSAGKSSSKRAADTDSEDDELPSKSKSRSAGKSSSKRAADTDSEDGELPNIKSKSRSAGKSSSKRAADTDSEDDELPSIKSKSRSAGKSSSKRASAANLDSEDDDPPSKPKSKATGKMTSKRTAAANLDSEEDEPHNYSDVEKSQSKSGKKSAKRSKKRH